MKKTPYKVANVLFKGLLVGVFFFPVVTNAYTIANQSPTPVDSSNSGFIAPITVTQGGKLGSFITNIRWNGTTATSGTPFYAVLYTSPYGLGNAIDCQTNNLIPEFVGASGNYPGGYSLVGPFYGTACNFSTGSTFGIRLINANSGGVDGHEIGFKSTATTSAGYWFIATTDTASSTLYAIQQKYLNTISTTTVSQLCQSNSSGSFLDAAASSFANGLCHAGVFLFVPSQEVTNGFLTQKNILVEQKFPFSWITDLRSQLEGLSASSTENFFNLTINFGSTTQMFGFTELTVISTSTMNTYLSTSTRNAIKNLLATMFYLAAIYFIYRQIQGVWHKQTA